MYKLSFQEMIEAVDQIIRSLEDADETAYGVVMELAYQLRDEMIVATE